MRIVVVGATAPSLQDLHETATTKSVLMPGPEVHANAISTLLRGMPLRSAAGWVEHPYPVRYALRLAAGFGSQISMLLLRWVPTTDGKRADLDALCARTRLPARECMAAVTLLEIAGAIECTLTGEIRHR